MCVSNAHELKIVDNFAKKKRKVRDTLCAPKTKTKKKVRRQLVTLAKKKKNSTYQMEMAGHTKRKDIYIYVKISIRSVQPITNAVRG